MSKMDDMRAMREARYEAGKPPAPATRLRPPERSDVVEPAAESPGEELCGHRNIGGRTCTREKGHTAKSHRYS